MIMLAGCNSEDGLQVNKPVQDTPRFSATINATGTRAYDTSWDTNDEIGISGTSGEAQYTNVCHFTSGSGGNFTPKDESKKIYFQDNNEVTFTTYYPWNDLKGSTTIIADTWQQAEQKKFDFLWAEAKGSKAHPNVAFRFAHKMAKVVLTVKRGTDVNYDEVKAAMLLLDGFKHQGSFNVTTGTAEATGNESVRWLFAGNAEADAKNNAPFKMDDLKQTVSYTLIFFPQEFDAPLPFTAELKDIIESGAAVVADEQALELLISMDYGCLRLVGQEQAQSRGELFDALVASPMDADELARFLDLSAGETLMLLAELEAAGTLERMADGRFAPTKAALLGQNGGR